MNELYDINEGLALLKKRKTMDILVWAALLPLGGISAALIVLGFKIWMAILFAILWFAYGCWVITYAMFLRLRWNQRYHFLAKIEQFDRRDAEGEITAIAPQPITNEGMSLIEVRIGEEVFYIETEKAHLLSLGTKCRIAAVDGVIIAYEQI